MRRLLRYIVLHTLSSKRGRRHGSQRSPEREKEGGRGCLLSCARNSVEWVIQDYIEFEESDA